MNKNNNEILRACGKCGKIHKFGEKCPNFKRDFRGQFSKRNDTVASKIRGSTQWKKKRSEILQKANYLCEYCFENNRLTLNDLSIHHIQKLENNPSLAFNNKNLICLCKYCHKLADLDKIDAETLKRIAENREFLS